MTHLHPSTIRYINDDLYHLYHRVGELMQTSMDDRNGDERQTKTIREAKRDIAAAIASLSDLLEMIAIEAEIEGRKTEITTTEGVSGS